jgi:hypothetical protein
MRKLRHEEAERLLAPEPVPSASTPGQFWPWGRLWQCLKTFFSCGTRVWTQSLTLARQVLLPLEPLRHPFFCDGFFPDRVLWTIYLCWFRTAILLISASWVARITGRSHWHLKTLLYCRAVKKKASGLKVWLKWQSAYLTRTGPQFKKILWHCHNEPLVLLMYANKKFFLKCTNFYYF